MIEFAWRLGGWCLRSSNPLQSGIPVLVQKKSGDLVEAIPGICLFKFKNHYRKSYFIYEIQDRESEYADLDFAPMLAEEGCQ